MKCIQKFFSYVNNVCLLEGILKRYYLNLATDAKAEFNYTINGIEQFVSARESEIKVERDYRNKISAHTSYAKPNGDSLNQQSASLAPFWGRFNPTDNLYLISIGLGTVSAHQTKTPHYSLGERHDKVVEHFGKWEKEFEKNLVEIGEKCPHTYGDKDYSFHR